MFFEFRVVSIAVALFATFQQASAQSAGAAGAHTASCSIRSAPVSDADIAYQRREFKKAADLYAADFKRDSKDQRSRYGQIDSMIGARKLDDAAKLADEWTVMTPKEPYAILAASDVRHAEGDWLEAYVLALRAVKLDPCLPSAYQAMAQYEELAGYRSTARRSIALAHQLAPHDDNIRFDWITSLDKNHKFDELKKYIAESKAIDEKRRQPLLNSLTKVAAQSENHCELVSSTGPAHIPMTAVYGDAGIDYWGIEVAFNGKKRTLQIDTGASGFILTKSASAGTGLVRIDTARVGGFGDNGSNSILISRAASVHIGGLEFKDCSVETLANFGVMGGGNEIGDRLDTSEGLIGSDVFDRYLVTLDYIKHEVRLEPLPARPSDTTDVAADPLGGRNDLERMTTDRFVAPSMQKWTKMYRDGHTLIIPTRIGSGGTKLFVADTGSDSNLVDVKVAKEFTTSKDDITVFRGLSGVTTKTFETGAFTMDFAGLRLPIKSMNAMDLSRFEGISGFIGYPTLMQLVMHLDYRDNLVFFEAPNATKK